MLLDLSSLGLTGLEAEIALGKAGITVNKNTIPNEQRSPFVTSGLRIGTPTITTRGMKEQDMPIIGEWITTVLRDVNNNFEINRIKTEVTEFSKKFPLYPE